MTWQLHFTQEAAILPGITKKISQTIASAFAAWMLPRTGLSLCVCLCLPVPESASVSLSVSVGLSLSLSVLSLSVSLSLCLSVSLSLCLIVGAAEDRTVGGGDLRARDHLARYVLSNLR